MSAFYVHFIHAIVAEDEPGTIECFVDQGSLVDVIAHALECRLHAYPGALIKIYDRHTLLEVFSGFIPGKN